MSAFFGPGYTQIGKNTKLGDIPVRTKLKHEYDFGSATECLITVVGDTTREKGKRGVRLLARNSPPEFTCGECGATAEWIDQEHIYVEDNPFLCDQCSEELGSEMLLPVTNFPPVWASAAIAGIRTVSFLSSPRSRARGAGK